MLDFIVLGDVPGTDIQLSFIVTWAFILVVGILILTIKARVQQIKRSKIWQYTLRVQAKLFQKIPLFIISARLVSKFYQTLAKFGQSALLTATKQYFLSILFPTRSFFITQKAGMVSGFIKWQKLLKTLIMKLSGQLGQMIRLARTNLF